MFPQHNQLRNLKKKKKTRHIQREKLQMLENQESPPLKNSIHQENITTANIYAPSMGRPKYIKEI